MKSTARDGLSDQVTFEKYVKFTYKNDLFSNDRLKGN